MTALDFARLREGEAGCPSDLALDRLHVGELAEAESRQITAHIETCPACPGRIAARQAGFAAFPEVDPRPLLAAVRRRLHESEREPVGRRWLRQLGLYFAPVAAVTAALAIFLVVRPGGKAGRITESPGAADGVTDQTRTKGGLGLHVYRLAAGNTAQATVSGDPFAPGDRLRFVVDLPARGQVQIIGVESDGDLYVAWPGPGSEAVVSTLRPAGKGQELPGAVALDNSPGRETLYLVHCAQSSAAPQCTSQGAGKSPQCPPGCRLVPYVIDKVK